MSGKFGWSAKLGQQPCLFHILIIGIINKLTKQTVKILMRRLIRAVSSGFPLFANVCPNLPDVQSYLTLPYIMPYCNNYHMLLLIRANGTYHTFTRKYREHSGSLVKCLIEAEGMPV